MTISEPQAKVVLHPAHQEGSRHHVISYHGGLKSGSPWEWTAWRTCSEPRCELNVREEDTPGGRQGRDQPN